MPAKNVKSSGQERPLHNNPSAAPQTRAAFLLLRVPQCPLWLSFLRYTIPFRNSSRGYLVPRQVTPSFQRVRNIDRSSVYSNSTVLTGCRTK